MGKLYIVATPIGNLEDMTYRAVRVLDEADLILCEDTRHTKILLDRYGIKNKLLSYHKFNEQEVTSSVIEEIKNGKTVALVSDAGTPAVSDPGSVIVGKAREEGVEVYAVPGCCAAAAAVSVAGLDFKGFVFSGFLDSKPAKRKEELKSLSSSVFPIVFYCAPHDINKDIKDMFSVFGDRKITVIKELTKIHEKAVYSSLSSFKEDNPKGEFVIIVMPKEKKETGISVKEQLSLLLKAGLSTKDAVNETALLCDKSKKEVYDECLKLLNKK